MAKATVLVMSDTQGREGMARVLTALEATKELKEGGDEVELIFGGAGTTSAVALACPDHDLHRLYTLVEDKIKGICRFCARSFGVLEEAEEIGLTLLAEYDQHPSVRRLLTEGRDVITF